MPFPSMDFQREQVVRRSTMLPLALVLFLWCSLATAQATLGELLDAGALKLSAEEFRQELVQRAIVGPTLSGGTIEIIYVPNGTLQGSGSYVRGDYADTPIFGEWKIDEAGKICASMRVSGGGRTGTGTLLPNRCQFWFKNNGQYFLSDSDWDRSAKVLRRTVKQ